MTIKQKQLILCWFDCLPVSGVDGIWGPQSKAATVSLQEKLGIEADGDFGQNTEGEALNAMVNGWEPENATDTNVGTTGDWWDEIEYFHRNDPGIACPCGRCGGFPAEPVERLMRNADAARKHFGKPAIPSSTVRCAAHNAELPGSAANSLHMRGKAMDFAIPGVSASTLEAYVRTLPEVHECYSIDGSYVHMGVQKY